VEWDWQTWVVFVVTFALGFLLGMGCSEALYNMDE
jgi:hypothetical protein